ncbi:PTS sugar transporter subunit IIA [Anaerococcus nagyae]|uniref:PTS sugar transporter subunit IIA n=1 Tax=Anaerococcus nagyae TaxID=1755241 RepID=UPI00324D4420
MKLFDKNNIYISDAKTKDDLFKELFYKLKKDDLVTDDFLEMVKTREKSYPTGMDMSLVDPNISNIAIPHTEPSAVKMTRIIPVKLNNNISFNNMIDPSQVLEVKFIFMILNDESGNQTNILSDIMDFVIQTPDINNLFNIDSVDEIYKFIEENFRESVND